VRQLSRTLPVTSVRPNLRTWIPSLDVLHGGLPRTTLLVDSPNTVVATGKTVFALTISSRRYPTLYVDTEQNLNRKTLSRYGVQEASIAVVRGIDHYCLQLLDDVATVIVDSASATNDLMMLVRETTYRENLLLLVLDQNRAWINRRYSSQERKLIKVVDAVLEFRSVSTIRRGMEVIGRTVEVSNQLAVDWPVIELDLLFGTGFDRTKDLVRALTEVGRIKRHGQVLMDMERKVGVGYALTPSYMEDFDLGRFQYGA